MTMNPGTQTYLSTNKNAHLEVGVFCKRWPLFLVAREGFELWVMSRQTRHGFNRLQPPKPDFILSLPLLNGAFCRMTFNTYTPNKPDPSVIIRTAAESQHPEHATIG